MINFSKKLSKKKYNNLFRGPSHFGHTSWPGHVQDFGPVPGQAGRVGDRCEGVQAQIQRMGGKFQPNVRGGLPGPGPCHPGPTWMLQKCRSNLYFSFIYFLISMQKI